MTVHILIGDVREKLKELADESVHCVVTSPPYWGLRDYAMDGQLGLEKTIGEHVGTMADIFDDVRRVLRKDGTLWLNYGDSYASGGNGIGSGKQLTNVGSWMPPKKPTDGLKPKDLCGIPWRVAFALQERGWWLRQDIIWHKPNPMPESVKDRCTKAHEYIFLLSKSQRYYFDAEAIKEPASENTHPRIPGNKTHKGTAAYEAGDEKHRTKAGLLAYSDRKRASAGIGIKNNTSFEEATAGYVSDRNRRSVWTIGSAPFSQAHFATFPPELPELCIKAGSKAGDMILDPFGGAGTTGMVADRLQRHAILIELNSTYAAMAQARIDGDRGALLDLMEAAQ